MDILPFYEAAGWMLRGGEMDGRHAASTRKSSDGMSTIPHPQQRPWDEHESTFDVLKRQCLNAEGGFASAFPISQIFLHGMGKNSELPVFPPF